MALEAPRPETPPSAPGTLASRMVLDSDGPRLSWVEPAESGLAVRVSAFKKGAWTPAQTVVTGPDVLMAAADPPIVRRGAGGVMVAAWTERLGEGSHASAVELARSTDEGATWQRLGRPHPDTPAVERAFPALAPEGDGMRVFWLDGRETAATPPGPTALRTALVGASVGPEEVVDPRVCDCCGLAATAAEGVARVAYRDRGEDEVRDVTVARTAGGAFEGERVHVDGWRIDGCPANGPALAGEGEGLVVAWFTAPGGKPEVRLAAATGGRGGFGPAVRVAGGGEAPIGRVSVAKTAPDEAVVAWVAEHGGGGQVKVARVGRDGRVGEPVLVAAVGAGRDAGWPQVAADGDGVLVVWTGSKGLEAKRLGGSELPKRDRASWVEDGAEAAARGPRRLPRLEAATVDGDPRRLDVDGRAKLVNVWATWCGPCIAELPALSRLHATRSAEGLDVIGVSTDPASDLLALRRAIREHRLDYAVWHDPADRVSQVFGLQAIPATFLYDRAGRLVWSSYGAFREGDPGLARALDRALAR